MIELIANILTPEFLASREYVDDRLSESVPHQYIDLNLIH